MGEFYNLNRVTSLIKHSTCFKNPDKPTCINLILTNQPNCFQDSNVFETELSYFHLLTVNEFKMGFQKVQPKIVNYRDYKNFGNKKFRPDVSKFDFGVSDLGFFKNTIFCIFNKHTPIKRRYIRANEAPFMTKKLYNTIMKRSKLRNKFLKSKPVYIATQFCEKLLSNIKRTYFNSLDIEKVTDNQTF